MLKVLHILGGAAIGGIERLVLDLSRVQKDDESLSPGIFFTLLREEGFRKHFEHLNINLYSANLTSGYDLRLRKYLLAFRIFRQYDILHIHNFNIFIAISAVLSGKYIVYTEHGNFGFGRKWRIMDSIKRWLLAGFLNKFVHFLTFNSIFTEQTSQRRYGLKTKYSSVIHNGVSFHNLAMPDDELDQDTREFVTGKFIIGTMSRLVGFKRIDRLITAFAVFQQNKPARLLVVGDGPLKEELNRLVRELGVSEKVRFCGFRSNALAYQNVMSVCVFPSENEPFGLVAVEALALGKPVIVFADSGGGLETVGGYSQEDVVKNTSSLVERLNYYYEDPSRIIEHQTERIGYARSFDIETTAQKFKNLYHKLLPCVE